MRPHPGRAVPLQKLPERPIRDERSVAVDDQLGRLALTPAGLRERDDRVFRWAARSRVPVVSVMAGGYSRDPEKLIAARLGTLDAALTALGRPRAASGIMEG